MGHIDDNRDFMEAADMATWLGFCCHINGFLCGGYIHLATALGLSLRSNL